MSFYPNVIVYRDRLHAGTELAKLLVDKYKNTPSNPVVVIALPRGGLPIAEPICKALQAPLDIIVAKKIGFPGNEEYAIGAVTTRGTRLLSHDVIRSYRHIITESYLEAETQRKIQVAKEREAYLRGDNPPIPLEGKTVIIVDDGIATGSTMKAAVEDAKLQNPKKIVVAVPVTPPDTLEEFKRMKSVDDIIYCEAPPYFSAVGQFFQSFPQTSDKEAKRILDEMRRMIAVQT